LPQAGVGVGLILLVQEDPALGAVRDLFLTAGLALVTLNELVGPLLTRFALLRSGDAGNDRPRLIDFIREEHILTDFEARSKEDAIEQLVTWMVHTQQLGVTREALLRSVLARERELSTCVGSGLAIPHGDLGERGEIVGVMAISRDGLDFETPDGEPVHCIVLLATPSKDRDRHLEVLAALMRAVGADDNVRRRLFSARSPAHAYEILHAEESVDFNYFLD
jgi:mannitol/fructose-specific phosphotransferase system IIA component (Ntr-type)